MLYYELDIAGLKRKLPLCPINDNLYIAGFVMLGDWELSEACAAELIKKVPDYDYILTAEAKGITLAHEMAKQNRDEHYIVARKAKKLYMAGVFESQVKSITTDARQTLYLDINEALMMKGKRILIVDDVVSTGESLNALLELVNKAGGIVSGMATVLAEGSAAARKDIIYLEKLPLFNSDGTILA